MAGEVGQQEREAVWKQKVADAPAHQPFPLFTPSQTPAPGRLPFTFRVGLLISINPIQILPLGLPLGLIPW